MANPIRDLLILEIKVRGQTLQAQGDLDLIRKRKNRKLIDGQLLSLALHS
jgi:hypothetical protein